MTVTLSDTQGRAIAAIRDWYETRRHDQQIFRLFGYAGTGKTTITAMAIEALGLEPMTPGGLGGVLFAAFTGKATLVMTRRGYGGHRRDTERVKREGWHEQKMLAVSLDDQRLTWPERELVRQLGEKLYGKRPAVREVRHD